MHLSKVPQKTNQDPHDKKDDNDEETDEEEHDSHDNYEELSKEILKGEPRPKQKFSSENAPKSNPATGSHKKRTNAAESPGTQLFCQVSSEMLVEQYFPPSQIKEASVAARDSHEQSMESGFELEVTMEGVVSENSKADNAIYA